MNKVFFWAVAASSAPFIAIVTTSAGISPTREESISVVPAMLRVGAVPVKTWGELCKTDVFSDLTGLRIPPSVSNKVKSFYMVGDHITAYRGDEKGTLVVTKFEPMKELRVIWEADSGRQQSSQQFLIKRKPSGTAVEYWDKSSNMSEQASREKMAGIARFTSRFND